MNVETVKSIFAIFGGLAAIVTLIRLWRGRLKVRFRGIFSELSFPAESIRRMKEFRKAITAASRQELSDKSADIERITEIEKQWPSEVFDFRGGLAQDKFWSFEIINRGRSQISDLKIELPFDGVFEIQDGTSGAFKKEISLGDLRSRGRVNLRVWTRDFTSGDRSREIYLTHPEGSVSLQSGHVVYGAADSLGHFLDKSFLFLLVFSLLFWAVISGVYLIDKQLAPKEATTLPSTLPND